MYKSYIYQKNIARHSIDVEKAMKFDNCDVEISSSKIIIKKDNVLLLNSDLKFLEEDFHTISYLGKHSNGSGFRIIRPTEISLTNLKNRFECETAFSIASIDPTGYAVHFILSNPNQKPTINSVLDKGKKEQIQRLIEGCIMALQFNLNSNFVDFSKRILSLINDTSELSGYMHSEQVLQIMKGNRHIYSKSENDKIV